MMSDLIPDEEQLAEANKRYPTDHEVDDPYGETGVARSDPYGYDATANKAFLEGAMWERGRRPSPLTREAPTSGVYIHGPLGEALRPSLPEPAEVEWEYGVRWAGEDNWSAYSSRAAAVEAAWTEHGDSVVQRTKAQTIPAGDWVPVSPESEGKK